MTEPYEPTPDEIRLACELIRAKWPKARIRKMESYHEMEEIPSVHWPTDHMVRHSKTWRE